MFIETAELRRLVSRAFRENGVDAKGADVVSEALVEADLRGHNSHGVIRTPKWIAGIRAGAINPHCRPSRIRDFGAVGVLDGDRGLGPIVANQAVTDALAKAKAFGMGAVSVRNSAHIGMLALYAEKIADAGMVGLVTTNTEPGVAAFGSMEKLLGTNPLAMGSPTDATPLILDMSTSVVARGKIVLAQKTSQKIPAGWAMDEYGNPTTDPDAALRGALLPVGGPKGSGLAVFVDVLSGALAGAQVGRLVTGTMAMENQSTKGDFFLAINPSAFVDERTFLDRTTSLQGQLRSSKPAAGHVKVLAPGDLEREIRARNQDQVDLPEQVLRDIETYLAA